MPFKLKHFDLEKLYQLRNEVDQLISNYECDKKKKHIKSTVEEHGYCWEVDDITIEGLEIMKLPANIRLSTWDKEDFTDIHVNGLSYNQPDWVDRLSFDHSPKDDDDYEIPKDNRNDWECGDWDDPICNTGVIEVGVYYLPYDCPKNGTKWDGFNDLGNIIKYEVKNNDIICNGDVLCNVKDWKDFCHKIGVKLEPELNVTK